MDPSYRAQDVTRCYFCETEIVQSYCDVCHVNLCTPCIGAHIKNEYDKHKIVSFEQRKSTLIYPKCETHPNKACKYQCKDCNVFVCSHCTASTQHKGHEFLNLEKRFIAAKECIRKDTEELENLISPKYEEIAIDLENEIASLDGEYAKLATKMSRLREDLHREIDTVVNQVEKEINEIKSNHLSILRKHLDEIKRTKFLICEIKTALNELEESNKVCSTIDYSSRIKELSNLPPKVQVSMPNFIPKRIEREKLRHCIGELIPLSTTLVKRDTTKKNANSSARELLDKPKVLNTIKTDHGKLRSIACQNADQIWTSGETDDIKCFNTEGVLQRTIKQYQGIFLMI